jgi:hypothetical protein
LVPEATSADIHTRALAGAKEDVILFKSYFAVGNSVQYVAEEMTNEKLKLKRIYSAKQEVRVHSDFFGATKNTCERNQVLLRNTKI